MISFHTILMCGCAADVPAARVVYSSYMLFLGDISTIAACVPHVAVFL